MEGKEPHISIVTKRYTKKDGTVVERQYRQAYFPVEKDNKVTQKKIFDKVREVKKEDFEDFYKVITDFVNGKNVQPDEQNPMPEQ
jgi:hypothetical protein